MRYVRVAFLCAVAGCVSIIACGGDSDQDSSSGSAGSGGGGSGGSSASGGSGATGGSAGGGGPCQASEDYAGKYYGRYETDQGLADLLSGFAPHIGCVEADLEVDTDARTVSATGKTYPPSDDTPRTYTSSYDEGDAVSVTIAAREFGIIEISVACDGKVTGKLTAGPFKGNCGGTLDPVTGGDLICEALGPAGPLGEVDVSITRDPPDSATCFPPTPPPPTTPDCSMLPLSPEVGMGCGADCTPDKGGACVDGECLAVCLDIATGCSMHCAENESCLPLEQGGAPVDITIDGDQYAAGGCKLETGPKQAYESCGSERCNGFLCLAFAGAPTIGLCAPECFGNDRDCPPGPPGFTPVCTLRDQTGRQFCALDCDPTMPEASCPTDHACLPAGAKPNGQPICLPTGQ